jgi:hypothetical protein
MKNFDKIYLDKKYEEWAKNYLEAEKKMNANYVYGEWEKWERIPQVNYASPWDVDKFNSLSLLHKLSSLERIMYLFDVKNIGDYFIFNIISSETASSFEITIYFTRNTSSKTVFKRTCEIKKDIPKFIRIHPFEIEDKTQKLAEGEDRLFVKLICDHSDRKKIKLYHKAVDGSLKIETAYLKANKAGFEET